MKALALAVVVATVTGTQGLADVIVRFDESAPKDGFTITNAGTCTLGKMEVTLDLGASAAGLIFDVTGSGAGVSVYQPLELVSGAEFLESVPAVRDGDSRIVLPLRSLAAGQSIAFTIDVDDTGGVSETMVSGAEILGATVALSQDGVTTEAEFEEDAVARVFFSSCNA